MRKFLLAAAAVLAGSAASATTIDFEPLAPIGEQAIGGNYYSYVGDSYVEDGFKLTKGANEPFEFAVMASKDDRYTGSAALFNDTIRGLIKLSRVGGGAFDLETIDVSELNGAGAAVVNFVGTLLGGGSVFASFTTDGTFGLETFSFGSLFDDVVEVSWVQEGAFHQFDNINIDTVAAVPVPAGGVLLLTGMGALSLLRRKRKA